METKYFTRKINEGSVKATHICSFDNSIVLTKLVQPGKKVIDSVVTTSANSDDAKKQTASIKEALMDRITAIRINGMPTVIEDLGTCFDDDEVMEVLAFINGADMANFGGKKQTEAEKTEEELKNV